jgi:hypothetical protein
MNRTLQSFTAACAPTHASFTAEIVEHTPYARFAADMEGTILVITDHNDPCTRSVTNAIEDVLLLCRDRFGGHLPGFAIYRDTTGRWDGIDHSEGAFRTLYAIGETDRDRAIAKALSPSSAA